MAESRGSGRTHEVPRPRPGHCDVFVPLAQERSDCGAVGCRNDKDPGWLDTASADTGQSAAACTAPVRVSAGRGVGGELSLRRGFECNRLISSVDKDPSHLRQQMLQFSFYGCRHLVGGRDGYGVISKTVPPKPSRPGQIEQLPPPPPPVPPTVVVP